MLAASRIWGERSQIYFYRTRFKLVAYWLYSVSSYAQYCSSKLMTLLLISNWNLHTTKFFFTIFSHRNIYILWIKNLLINNKYTFFTYKYTFFQIISLLSLRLTKEKKFTEEIINSTVTSTKKLQKNRMYYRNFDARICGIRVLFSLR